MNYIRTLVLVATLATLIAGSPTPASSGSVTHSDAVGDESAIAHEILVRNATGSARQTVGISAVVEWVEERYELADIEPPSIEIDFHASRAECAGHGGLFTVNSTGSRIDICAVGEVKRQRTVLHELAHAWTHENLTDAQREEFLALRGLGTWSDHAHDWERRGNEHAAEIIAWGLGEKCESPKMLADEDALSLAGAFTFLTGGKHLCEPV